MYSERAYEIVGLGLFALLTLLPLMAAAAYGLFVYHSENDRRGKAKRLIGAITALMLLYGAVFADAFLLEPNWPRITVRTIEGPFEQPLQLLHLSDLHLEELSSRRDAWLDQQLQRLKPDLIVVTGDTHQTENRQADSLRGLLASIQAPLGVYHCSGYDDVKVLRQAAPHIAYLENDAVVLQHNGKSIGIVGLLPVGKRDLLYEALRPCEYRIALNHTPDLADEAASEGMHLYLCGHTHGGQVRIPGWGAIVVNCKTGKRFEGGLYRLRDMWVHTSRGFGLEPAPAPQVRFFCRPEITLFHIAKEPGL